MTVSYPWLSAKTASDPALEKTSANAIRTAKNF